MTPKEAACIDGSPSFIAHLFDPIDEIVTTAIREQQFPGCQVLVMQKGQVILDRSYGYLTYDSLMEVTGQTIYDIASVTKVASTTVMIMDLFEKGHLHLDDPISCYLTDYVGTNKENITIRQLLAHNSGLRPYLPFWEKTLKGDFLDPKCDSPIQVDSHGQLVDTGITDSMNNWMKRSSLLKFSGKSHYRYSDIGFMILHQIAEKAAGESMENYLASHFYQPLGLSHTYFNPSKKGVQFTKIAPTEFDMRYRHKQVWGDVHDRNAALLGGVAGHSGLFSNSRDLGILMSMIQGGGVWDNQSYLSDETIDLFNKRYYPYNRRALGWDKKNEHVSQKVSPRSFGHTGFTGTMVWVDPDSELVFIFLTNRIYPNVQNRKLITSNTRSRIQDVVYDALASIEKQHLADVK